jgi:predicted chitinase
MPGPRITSPLPKGNSPMTIRVLTYDISVVPQERYWDCGPASAQVVLNALGIIKSEDDLIAMIGTDEDGTDFVGLVENALDRLVSQANYTSVYMPNDPPTQAQKDKLWADIVRSIDAGYGVVMNFVAPPSNYPRGVDDSPNPSYGGGTIYHYVPAMGYNDGDGDPSQRAVYIADPGFSPHGYWISFDQCATLIPPKGYAAAMPAVVQPPVDTPPPPPAPTVPDAAVILSRATGISLSLATQILPTIVAGLVLAECTTVPRIAMAFAQWGWESARFSTTVEFGRGVGQPYFPYCGRTYGQLTWESNYAAFGQWCVQQGLITDPDQFVNDPDSLGDLRWAGSGAAWYWKVARPINDLVDAGDDATWTAGDVTYRGALNAVTAAINGGLNGLDSPDGGRRALWNLALAQGDALLQLLNEGDITMPSQDDWNALMGKIDALDKKVDGIADQLGPGFDEWGVDGDLGKNAAGQRRTLRAGLAALMRKLSVSNGA